MYRIQVLLTRVLPCSIALFFGFLILRFTELYRVDDLSIEGEKFPFYIYGAYIDLIFTLLITFFYCVFRLIADLCKIPRLFFVLHALNLLALILNFIMIEFFLTSGMMLDETLFLFSWKEITVIIGDGRITAGTILCVVGIIAYYFAAIALLKRVQLNKVALYTFGICILLSVFLVRQTNFESSSDHKDTKLSNNKLAYFTHRLLQYSFAREASGQVNIADFKSLDANFYGGKPMSAAYPLLHESAAKSEFAGYFRKEGEQPPNIVFIIVESLSSHLVGEKGKQYGSLLSFIDSLSAKSLFFPNVLSTCERTHNVLPAMLASVPNAPAGKKFMELEHPEHWSLMSLLKKYYETRFFCGVYLNFTNMDGFMKANHTEYLVRAWEKQFRTDFDAENIWGYPDGDLFRKSWLDYEKQDLEQKSRLDVLLTVSTHDPFLYPDKERYSAQVKDKINKLRNPSEHYLSISERADEFGAYVYMDDQLRKYFDRARKCSNFENTIFIITGDHGSPLSMPNDLAAYNVPLIIYSPLLKKPGIFHAVSTHLDLAPTLLNYLRLTYGLPLPSKVPFMGKELSFVKQFESKRSIALNTYRFQNENLVHKDKFLFHNQLYQITEGLELKEISNESLEKKLKNQLYMYEMLSRYTVLENKIIPKLLKTGYDIDVEYKEIKSFVLEKPSSEFMVSEYMNLGEEIRLNPAVKSIRVEFRADFFLENTADKENLPSFTVSLDNITGKNSKNICWMQHEYRHGKLKSGAWNNFSMVATLKMADIEKLEANNGLKLYLLNKDRKKVYIRNIKTKVLEEKNE